MTPPPRTIIGRSAIPIPPCVHFLLCPSFRDLQKNDFLSQRGDLNKHDRGHELTREFGPKPIFAFKTTIYSLFVLFLRELINIFRPLLCELLGKVIKHNERARVAPLYLTFKHPFRTQKNTQRANHTHALKLGVWFACSLWSAFSGLACSLCSC